MYWMAARSSSSVAVEAPRGGMAPLPLMATFSMASMPVAMKGAHAALSPNLGAPATPAPWQVTHDLSYSALPTAGSAAGAAAAGAAATTAAAGAAAAAGDAASAGAAAGAGVGAAAAGAAAAPAALAASAGAAGSASLPPAWLAM